MVERRNLDSYAEVFVGREVQALSSSDAILQSGMPARGFTFYDPRKVRNRAASPRKPGKENEF